MVVNPSSSKYRVGYIGEEVIKSLASFIDIHVKLYHSLNNAINMATLMKPSVGIPPTSSPMLNDEPSI